MGDIPQCVPCPDCGRHPNAYGSMIRNAEAITCGADGCEFDFDTGYLPYAEAVAAWNAAASRKDISHD